MLRIAICDDEYYFRENLKEVVSEYLKQKEFGYQIDLFSSGEKFLALGIEVIKYDVIFLDINMEKIDGMTAAKKIREVSKEVFIVFVTAYVNFTLEGYKVDAIRYLLKDNTNFKSTVEECMDAIMKKSDCKVIKREFKFSEGKKSIPLERILFIESRLHKLEFHVMEDDLRIYTMYKTLSSLESELEEEGFVRIHQSYLVNIKYIKSVVRYKVILTNETELIVPKARYNYVRDKFVAYKGEV